MLANVGGGAGRLRGRPGPTSPKVGIFLTDLGNFAAVNALYEAAIGDHRPARTTVGVAALPAGRRVEIECWVYLPDDQPES